MTMQSKSVLAAMVGLALLAASITAPANAAPPDGWMPRSAREEIRPEFRYEPAAGRNGQAALVIAGDARDGTSGWWQKSFPIEGGKTYRFSAWRKSDGVSDARVAGLARVIWQDENGKSVKRDEPSTGRYQYGKAPTAEPEYPLDQETDTAGWTEVADTYQVPA